MPTTRLSHSVPYWVLVGGSVLTTGGGAYLLISKLSLMATTISDGTATGVEVYAGQIWAVLGAILVGTGLVGLALALTLAGLRAAIPTPATVDIVDVVEPPAWEDDVIEVAEPAAETTVVPAASDDDAATGTSTASATR